MTTTDDDVFLAFERWAEGRGLRFARDACVVKRDAHRGAWIEGARDGGRGEIVLAVPKSACLSTTTSALGEGDDGRRRERLREMGVVGLVACVARERASGETSAFAAYAETLPWDANQRGDGEDAREVRALSRGTTVEVMMETDEEMLMRDHESVVEFYANEIGEEGGAPPTEEEFRQAAAVVASRAFFIDEDAGQGLVPYADLFNHRGSGGAHVVVRGCDSEKEEELRLECARAISRGEEVFNSFGDDHDNSLLFYKYGFVERDNSVRVSRFDAPRVFELERLRRGATNGEEDFVSDCGVFGALASRLLDSYEGLVFEINEDGSLSRGLLALLRCASLDEAALGEYLEWDDDDEAPSAVESSVERTMVKGEPDRDVWNDIDDYVFVTAMVARFLRFIDDDALKDDDERASLFSGDAASLVKAIGAQIKTSYEYLDEHADSVTFGEGLVGVSAAHLVRAQELELLLKALLRHILSDEDEDQDDDEGRQPKRRLIASSLYDPSVYITSKS